MEPETHSTPSASRPVLFVDVDGVLSLFGLESDPTDTIGPLHWIDGMAHYIPPAGGARLVRLAERFELVWATGWEERANQHLPAILDLPFGPIPCLTFGGRAVFGSSDWKLDAMGAYAGDRAAAWIDDNIDEEARLWALSRQAPTLLIETRSDIGMTDQHVAELLSWAGEVTPRGERTGRAGPHPA